MTYTSYGIATRASEKSKKQVVLIEWPQATTVEWPKATKGVGYGEIFLDFSS